MTRETLARQRVQARWFAASSSWPGDTFCDAVDGAKHKFAPVGMDGTQ